jgi:alpha-L-rhamnosidase
MFDLVPNEQRQRVFNRLVEKITHESKNHVGTGLIGGQWLMRTLSDNGRPDLAYTLAAQKSYPSWGYMIEKGATTLWELWNGDTADPAMNSQNHVMLAGDLIIWFHEYLAGIQSDPTAPGFRHIIMRPHFVGDLQWARAQHHSPYGPINSEWRRQGTKVIWDVTVPPNSAATLHFPSKEANHILEGGKPLVGRQGIHSVDAKGSTVIVRIGSGVYHFSMETGN